jgi:hypothetical protein
MVFSLLFLLVTLPILYLVIKYQSPIEAAWFNDNWLYRATLTIGNTGSADSNKKVKFDIDTATLITAGKMQSDCGDSRFTDINGRALNYYIDTAGGACNTSSTDYYVLVPTIYAGTTVLYHYYGNPSAQNGTQVSQFSEATFTPTSGPTTGTEEKSAGPVAYWKFDEGYGSTTNNSTSTSGINGTLLGSTLPTWQSENQCVTGKCLWFNGSSANIKVNRTSAINISNSGVSVSAFIKPQALVASTYYTIVEKAQVSSALWDEYYLIIYDGKPRFCISDGTNLSCTAATTNLSLNTWQYLVGTWNGTTNPNSLNLYLDGKLIKSDQSTVSSIQNSNQDMYIGADIAGGNRFYFNGFIDDVKIYPYARTSNQILTDYNNGSTLKGSSVQIGSKNPRESFSQGLVGYWKMDEASTPSIDSSGNGNSGTWAGNVAAASGKFGNGTTFDGSGDYVSVADNASLRVESGNFTVSVWVKPNIIQEQVILFKGTPAMGSGYILVMNRSGSNINLAKGGVNDQPVSYTFQAGNWYHIVAVQPLNGNITYYINGQSIGSYSNTQNYSSSSGQNFYIGDADTYFANKFAGSIDETRIYNRSLSPKEVRDLYNWAPGPVGYWNMDEGTGTNVYDKSGNGYNSTAFSTPTWATGKFGKALSFNGTSDYVGLPNIPLPHDFTISFWAYKRASHSGWAGVISNNYSPYTITMEWSSSNYIILYTSSNGSSWTNTAQSASTLTTGQWYYITGVKEGSTAKLYINGVQSGSTGTGTDIYNGVFTAPFIGRYATTYNYNGFTDDVRIYNYARSSKQIVEDMNAGHPAPGSPVGSQLMYYKFDEGHDSTINNTISSSYAGTAYGSPVWTNAGKFGKALTFDGNTDKVIAASSSTLRYQGGDLALSVWVKPDSTDDGGWIISKPWNGSGEYNYYLTTSGGANPSFSIFLRGATTYSLDSNKTVAANSWHYVAVTVEGATKNVRFYIDGVQTNSATHSITDWTPGTGDSNLNLVLGCVYPYGTDTCAGSTTYSYKGDLDEVKVYNSALTEDEIKLDYNRGKAMVLGKISTESDGFTPSDGASREYCIPGDTTSCSAPVGEWKFEENTGSNAYDTSGNGNTGTWNGTGSHWTTGKIGAAGKFNGTDDYVDTGSGASLDLTNIGTVEMWFKPTTAFSGAQPSQKHLMAGGPLYYYFSSSSSLLIYYLSDGIASVHSDSGSWGAEWYQVVITSDGTTLKMFINGVQQTTTSGVGALTFFVNTGNLTISKSGPGFPGLIDQVRIFNYARTPAQIAYDYSRGKPVGQWKFEECQGITLNDASGNANTGTLTVGASGSQTSPGTCTDGLSTSAWYNGRTGKYNSSLNFDGTDDYVSVTDSATWQLGGGTGSFTIEAWANLDTLSQDSWWISALTAQDEGGGSTNKWIFAWDPITDKLTFHVNTPGGSPNFQISSNTFSAAINTWYHVALTRSDDTYTFYKNGTAIGSASQSGTIPNAATPLTIGWGEGSGSFDGLIDDVRIYNYALTANQIKTLFNENSAIRFGPSSGSP